MSKRIYKYPIAITDTQAIGLPIGAQILTAAMQGDKLMMWALVDPEEPKLVRTIEIFGTGHSIDEAQKRRYISTFQLEGGSLVFHVFEKGEQ